MTKIQESKNKKNEILKNLTDWCFDPLGDLVDAKALINRNYQNEDSYWFRYYNDETEIKTTPAELTLEDYQEVKEAMIKEITQNPRDWKIEREGELTVIKHKSGRKHWRSGFPKSSKRKISDEEWTEIENALNSSSSPEIPLPPSKEQQAQQEQPTREIWHMGHRYQRIDLIIDNKHNC